MKLKINSYLCITNQCKIVESGFILGHAVNRLGMENIARNKGIILPAEGTLVAISLKYAGRFILAARKWKRAVCRDL